MIGERFGRLKVIGRATPQVDRRRRWRFRWRCRCNCGKEAMVLEDNLKGGRSRSCGCLAQDRRVKAQLKHGFNRRGETLPEYDIWKAMKQRCANPNNISYKHYGARGIKVCRRWERSFLAFIKDVGRRPSPNHSIDRIDNDGDYKPGNVRWATESQQQRNKRKRVSKAGPPLR